MPIAATGFGLMTPLLLGGNGRGRLGAQGRRRMRRAWPAKGTGTAWRSRSGRASAHPGSAHYGLAGTNGAAINRLARDRRGAASGHARPGRLWLNLPGSRTRLLLLQTRHHVGARRYDWTSGRLSCEIWTRLRTQRCARSGTGQRRGAFARGRGRTSYRLGWKRHRHRRHGRRGSGRRQGLPRTRQDLAGARRGNGTRRNWTSAQRGMQRRSATGGQWRP